MSTLLRTALATCAAAGIVTAAGYHLDNGEGPAALGPGTVEVVLDLDYTRFAPDHLVVRQGTMVRFVLRNHDPIRHEFIVGPPEVHTRHPSGHEAVHPPIPGEVTVEPNATAETVFQFDDAGTVVFACHLPGHDEYGMHGTVEVLPV